MLFNTAVLRLLGEVVRTFYTTIFFLSLNGMNQRKKIQQNAFSDSCIQKWRLPRKAILSFVIYHATLSQKNVTLRSWFESIFTIHPDRLHLLRTHTHTNFKYIYGSHVLKISRGNVILQIGKTFWGYFAMLYRSILYGIFIIFGSMKFFFLFRPITHAFLLLMHIAVRQISALDCRAEGWPRGRSSRPQQYLPLPYKRPDRSWLG